MKKIILTLAFLFSISCADADLQIETIDFDSTSISFCGSLSTSTQLFFKINGTEAIILNLQSGLLQNQVSEGTLVSTIPSQSSLIYRVFDGDLSSGYFCDDIPPTSPNFIEEIVAEAGSVLITTTQSETDTTQFVHQIELSEISLINQAGERLTDLRINEFGTLTTTSSSN